ncbi:MAG: J domain-containing protein [Acidimicrobiia bacterium]|nr:J domain-containing protein [Acidimicrobiia bacterium]
MNLYEEFGLSNSATTEQLRHAHRNMARLLHPDNFQDEELRRLAEQQMKRVNAIYAVLSDPKKRKKYDLEQSGQEVVSPIRQFLSDELLRHSDGFGVVRRNLAWVLATLSCIFGIYWLLSRYAGFPPPERPPVAEAPIPQADTPSQQVSPARPSAASPAATADLRQLTQESRELRQLLHRTMEERDAAIARLSVLRSTPSIPTVAQAAAADAPPISTPVEPLSAPSAPEPRREAKKLSGTWVYLPPAKGPSPADLYPAEYIELILVEQSGFIVGRYRGRYRVTDRAISPEVRFMFEGKSGDNARFNWTGNGGARGEVELKQLSENTLSVDWYTSQFGRQTTLSSGTAVLVRRQE